MEPNVCVNCIKQNCPIPLIETRKAVNAAKKGDIIEITGTHPASKKEIPMAVEAMKLKLLSVEEKDGVWKIRIQK
jgi:tRNA 2-thiouridine synthesizing protein A